MPTKAVLLWDNQGVSPAIQQPKVSFSDLPRELRDAIYHQLWIQTPTIHLRRLCQDSPCYNSDIPGTQRGLSRWLLTSRSMFQEGLQQLYRRAAWKCRGNCNLKITTMVPFLVVDVVTDFTLVANAYLDTFRQKSKSKYVVTPSEDLGVMLSRFGPQLKKFGLRFKHFIAQEEENVPDQNWVLDLSCLNSVSTRLDTFSVHCEARQLGSLTIDTLASALPVAYEAETQRIGARLVGEDSAVEVSKNTFEPVLYGLTRRETKLIVIVKCHGKSM